MDSMKVGACVMILGVGLVATAACGSDSAATDGAGGDAGASSSGASGGEGGTSNPGSAIGSSGCAPYTAPCGPGGSCVPAGNDPKNCGACGKTCDGAAPLCSQGGCVAKCPPGLEPCNGACVDTASDNANCGKCGTTCDASKGKGCVAGGCADAKVFPAPAACGGGSGPPVVIDPGGTAICGANLASTTFTWGVCSCSDAAMSSKTFIDGFDSALGPWDPAKPKLGGGLGANGKITADSEFDIWGQMWAASKPAGVNSSSKSHVRHDMRSGGPVIGSELYDHRDAYVSGSMDGQIVVTGTLHQSPGMSRQNGVSAGAIDDKTAVTVPDPCGCKGAAMLDVPALVAARKTNNDNATIGLSPDIMAKSPPARLDLPCGSYYLTGFSLSSASAIVVHGNTALYIDGSVTAGAFLTMTLDPGAQLDVFISGTLTATSQIKLGNVNYPALARFYIGTSGTFELSSSTNIAGNIWAGKAHIVWTSNTDMFGSIFAGDFTVSSDLNLHNDQYVVDIGAATCKPVADAGASSSSSGGPTGCGSCRDCNNQACVNGACGACTDSSQCCAPLVCSNGSCVSLIH